MEDIQNRLISLLDNSGKDDTVIERELNLPRSTIYDWRNGRSKSYKKYLLELATYFKVSADYLLGNEQKNKPVAERDGLKEEILKLFTGLSNEDKKELIAYARYKVDHQSEK
jgi:repressor LexA